MQYKKFAEIIGQQMVQMLEELGSLSLLGWVVISNIFRGRIRAKLTLEQMVKIGYDSLPLALASSAFIGMVFAVQIASEFMKFGAGKYVGGVMAIAMAREFGPSLVGIVIAGRVAAAIAAELGTMKVTEQIDALEALGSNPIRYLVIPRFLACAAMLPLLAVTADFVGFFGGYLVAAYVVHINPIEYMENARTLLEMWDVIGGLFKAFVFGMLIAIIACYKGLRAQGGAKGVGAATTSSVVSSLISLFVFNYFLSIFFFK